MTFAVTTFNTTAYNHIRALTLRFLSKLIAAWGGAALALGTVVVVEVNAESALAHVYFAYFKTAMSLAFFNGCILFAMNITPARPNPDIAPWRNKIASLLPLIYIAGANILFVWFLVDTYGHHIVAQIPLS